MPLSSPCPETATFLLATAAAEWTVLSTGVERPCRKAWPILTEQAQTKLNLCCPSLHPTPAHTVA